MSKLKGCMEGLDAERFKSLKFCSVCDRYGEYKDCKQYRMLNQRFRVWVETEVQSL